LGENRGLKDLIESLENNLTAQKDKFIQKISDLNSSLGEMKSKNIELENLVKSLEGNLTAQKEKFTDKISDVK